MRIPHGLRSALASQTGGSPPPTTDEYFGDVSLLLYGDGTNGSTAIVDSSSNNHAITVNNDAQISTTQSKFSGSSMYFDGNGDYLAIADNDDFELGSGDFTLEAWVYLTGYSASYNGYYSAMILAKDASGGRSWSFGINGTASSWTSLSVSTFQSSSPVVVTGQSGSFNFALNTWYHVAAVKNNGTARLYVNGTDIGGGTLGAAAATSTVLTVGAESPSYQAQGYGYFFPGYIDDLRITKGVARYTSNFTPPTASFSTVTPGEKYFYQNSLLLSADGSNGSTAIVDSSANAHTITANGDAQISTTQGKFGGSSLYFDGSGDYLTAPVDSSFEFGTGDFTVECWLYLTNNTGSQPIVLLGNGASGGPSTISYSAWYLFYLSGTGLRFYRYTGTETFYTFSTTLSTNTWYHIAVSRSGTSLRCFVDGTQVGSTVTTSLSYNKVNNDNLHIGRVLSGSNSGTIYYLHGYLDDLRITKGVARYTGDFTIPTSEASSSDPYFSSTKLLLNGNGTNGSTTFTDSSNSSHTVTANGDAQISTAQSKFGGASMKFDGNDSIEVASSTDLSFGSGDFTIECWAYFNSLPSYMTVATFDGGGSYASIFFAHLPSLNCYISGNGTSWNVLAGNSLGTPSTGVWHHLALVREGNVYRGFLDGVQGFSVINSSGPYGSSALARIGNASATLSQGIDGYIEDFRVTKGVARYGNFAVPTAGFSTLTPVEPYFHNNSLLLHGDGTNGSTTFKDDSINNHTITANGNVQISTAQSKFGGSSMYFDGTGDYVDFTIDSTTLSSDFTIEAWVYRTGTGQTQVFFGTFPHTVLGISLNRAGTGKTALYIGNGSSWQTLDFRSTGTIATNTWTHLAVVRHNNVITIYHDGVSQGSTSANMPTGFNGGARIGAGTLGSGEFVAGYIDDFRITKGVARYTANFTPPTSAFPDL